MLINNWYVLGESATVGTEPVAVHALGQDFVLFRDAEGKARCLSDVCVHKGGSLCRGKVVDGTVQCPYHGWRYDGDGQCVEIPSIAPERKIPKRARVDAYPTQEQWGWIWAFLGDLPEDERPPLPDFFPEYEQQTGEWRFLHGKAEFDCNYVRAVENGVDRGHAVFVHTDFGNPQRPVIPEYEVEYRDNRLYGRSTSRPLNKRGAWREELPDERSDRTTEVQIFVPAPCIRIQMHMQPPKSQIIVTGYTPIDEGRTQLHFIQARNFMTDEKYDEDSLSRVHLVLQEDAVVLNYLQPARVPPTLADELHMPADIHGTEFRKKVKSQEANGQAIDTRAMKDEDDYTRVIPSPRRGIDPKNWVLKPVLMKPASDTVTTAKKIGKA
jgi:phenylpropionate dioxygenase-like ring-hydroxylating dioxygenase large terminal subunit